MNQYRDIRYDTIYRAIANCGFVLISFRSKSTLMLSWLDIRRRIQLIQDFEMPTVSNCISVSNDGRYIFATGKSQCYQFLNYS